MASPPAVELLPVPAQGRRFTARRTVRLGDVDRSAQIRFDAIARYLQDVASDDAIDAGGRSWAERRTTLRGLDGAAIEGVSLWVQIDVETGRPSRLGDDFDRLYGPSAGGRAVSSKLSLPKAAPDDARTEPWSFRATDVDPFGHVNNAAQFAVIEHVVQRDGRSRCATCEVEFLAPAPVDRPLSLVGDGEAFWLTDSSSLTAFRVTSP